MIRICNIQIVLSLFFFASPLAGQQSDFSKAEDLLNEQRFNEAAEILEQLHSRNPESQLYLVTLIDALHRSGRTSTAIEKVDSLLESSHSSPVRLKLMSADLHHRSGNPKKARIIWENLISESPDDISMYYRIGNAMTECNELQAALNLYDRGRSHFQNRTLFLNEIFALLVRTGEMDRLAGELTTLVFHNPERESYVRQRVMEGESSGLLDRTARHTESILSELSSNSPYYPHMHRFYLWLLLETGEVETALKSATDYEEDNSRAYFPLLQLAEMLESSHRFDDAAKVYRRAIELSNGTRVLEAADRLGAMQLTWARDLGLPPSEELDRQNQLYQTLMRDSDRLLQQVSNSDLRRRVLNRLVTLSIEYRGDAELAGQYLSQLQELDVETLRVRWFRARIDLLNRNWRNARHAFSTIAEETDQQDLRLESQYYLGLSDFLAGDYEYALLQLQELEQHSQSAIANRALKIRLWIQQGERSDSTGHALEQFTECIRSLHQRDFEGCIPVLEQLEKNGASRLVEHALVEASSTIAVNQMETVYEWILRVNDRNTGSPLREQLLWKEVVLSELHDDPETRAVRQKSRYEQILQEFPQGFYASRVRDRLQSTDTTNL